MEDLKYQTFVGWVAKDRNEYLGKSRKQTRRKLRMLVSYGHVNRFLPEHHFANKHGYVREHRLMWEYHNKAILLPWAMIYHVNGDRTDNRIENLKVVMRFSNNHRRGPSSIAKALPKILKEMGLD